MPFLAVSLPGCAAAPSRALHLTQINAQCGAAADKPIMVAPASEPAVGPSDPPTSDLAVAIAREIPRLQRHALSLVYSRPDAEDLVQDCLEAALNKQTSLKERSRLRSWLFSILNNLFLMRLRAGKQRGTAVAIEEFTDSLALSVPAPDRGAARDLANAMGMLSAEHRQILLLINVEGYGYQETAGILGVPVGTVMSRLARARQRLRALLEGEGLQAGG